jgi:hypothetical protein
MKTYTVTAFHLDTLGIDKDWSMRTTTDQESAWNAYQELKTTLAETHLVEYKVEEVKA